MWWGVQSRASWYLYPPVPVPIGMATLVTGADAGAIMISDANARGTAFDSIAGASSSNAPTIADFESIWGPTARDIRMDPDRFRRTARKHLTQMPPELQGQQLYINDRVDGLITGATGSPFTTLILPYHYCDAPDAKINWRVWSYDEVSIYLQLSQKLLKTLSLAPSLDPLRLACSLLS